MKILKAILILALISALLLLSSCGDSDNSHVAAWSEATLLSNDTVSRYPQMAADGNGDIIAVWAESTGFYANRYVVNSGWETPQKVGAAGHNWTDFRIAVSQSGHAIVVWVQDEDNSIHVQAVRYAPGVGWGEVENLVYIGMLEDIAIDDTGNAFIVAENTMLSDARGLPMAVITIARYNQTYGWSYDHIDIVDTAFIYGYHKFALDASGNGFLLCVHGESDISKIFVRRFSQGVLGEPVQLAETSTMDLSWVNIDLGKNGNAMVLWGLIDLSSAYHTYLRRYDVGNGLEPTEQIGNTPTFTVDKFLAIDPNGNIHAIWIQMTGNYTSDIYTCKCTPSNGWQTPQRIGTGRKARFPMIAADAFGNVFATWQEYDPSVGRFGGDGKIFANSCRAGSNWGAQQQLSTVLGDADKPMLIADRSRGALIMWSERISEVDGFLNYGTFFSRFE